MILEVSLGISLGVMIFLFYLGYDITPFIILVFLGIMFYLMLNKKGLVKNETFQEIHSVKDFRFENIGGQEVAKQELKEALEFLIRSHDMKKRGIRPLKGILLTGPPGTGKPLLAKAAANYSDAVYLATSGSEFIEMYAGVGAQRVRKIFQAAREKARKSHKNRAIIFIDEIDVLGAQRGSHASHMEYDQTLNQFLVEMDGLNNNDDVNILVIGATNRPDLLDQALLRPGRFDRQVKVDFPTLDGRLEILELHTKNKKLADDVSLKEIAKETYGFSGAHLENVANEAAILALRNNSDVITLQHFKEAIDKVMLGEKLADKANPQILHRVAVHEAGHALISELVKPNSVSQVTVTSRGNALGYVRQSQEEDQKLYTCQELRNQIKVCLAGAISEKIVLGDKSTGAGNDFHQAVKMAKTIINSGLSSLGVVSADDLPSAKINIVIQEIIHQEEMLVEDLLNKNIDLLKEIIDRLIKEEKISGECLRKIINRSAA
ncbi:MAG: AAA family ATPase [Clostridia bacterium]|nr:AAA family ATPase [Clostridia bacterium]